MRDLSATALVAIGAATLLAACTPAPSAAPGDVPTASASLPLQRGFYVSQDAECGAASNATLSLLGPDGYGGARYFCRFEHIEAGSATQFRVTESCAELFVEEPPEETQVVQWTLHGDRSYTRRHADGEDQGKYCEQHSLPEPWRDNDISDVIGSSAAD